MDEKLAFGYRTVLQPMLAISVHFDNKVTMSEAYISGYNGKLEICLWNEYVRQLIVDGNIIVVYVRLNQLFRSIHEGTFRD